METQEVFDTAVAAVTALVNARGLNATFPFDALWSYVPQGQDVPSLQRPSARRPLVNGGYIVPTGGITNSESQARAGSKTPEYRPGPFFLPPQEVPPTAPAQVAPPSVASELETLVGALEERGFITTPEQVVNFYLALLASPIVIMTGTSGTGKSRLPWLFAELTGAGFRNVPVKPQWDDNSDMFGFTSPIQTSQFIRGEFTTAIEAANSNPGFPFIVLLDEMNLAAVEHYFSDFLSVVESRRRQNGQVITNPLPLDLPQPPSEGEDPYASLRTLFLPSYVRVVGTANMDETTRSFSPKVLDRAFSIEFADVDLTAFPMASPPPATGNTLLTGISARLADATNPVSIIEAYSQASGLCLEAAEYLETVRSILAPTGISFAYRTRDAVCYYMYHWGKDNLEGLLPKRDALDYCILQKVLPKIHGQGEMLGQALQTLKSWLDGDQVESYSPSPGFNRSAEKLERMISRLNADGTTTYWGS